MPRSQNILSQHASRFQRISNSGLPALRAEAVRYPS